MDMCKLRDGMSHRFVGDPFGTTEHYLSGLDEETDDYVWLEYSLADERRQQKIEDAAAEARLQA